MGLFGALFAGVSGVDSQSNKIGIISNNISNVNTVGFKQGSADFDTLVVPSGTTSFSPGGVIGNTQNLVSEQGIISATTSSTDVAISGNGFFVVNTKPDGTGQTLYTRSGSFTQDSQGNFVNSDGYYLQGLPIDAATGAAEQANNQNLKTVSINQSASGAATATTTMTLAANLNSAQAVLAGPGETTSINSTDLTNVNNTGTQIIASTTSNGLKTGDTINMVSTGADGSVTNTFTYGGYVSGRNIVTGTPDATDNNPNDVLVTGADTATTGTTATTGGLVTVNVTNPADFQVGSTISVAGVTGADASSINGQWTVTGKTGSNGVTFQVTNTALAGGTENGTITATNRTYNFAGNILDATTDTGDFLGTTGTSPFAPNATEFTIATGNTTTTYTYNSVPNTTQNQFNSLSTLAQAINNTTGLTASIVNHQLLVSATNANDSVTFANVDAAGSDGLAGINWTQELGLQNEPGNTNTSVHMFNSLSGLADQINTTASANLTATVNNPTSSTPTLSVHEANPLQTIQISDGTTPANTGSSLVSELGFLGLNGAALSGSGDELSTGILPATYNPINTAVNMSSGAVTPQYSKDVTIYDAQGNSHTLALNFAKLNTNTWAVEATAVPASDVLPAASDGQVAYGTLTFDGSGNLISAVGSIASTGGFTVNWTNGAASSTITADLGLGGSTGIIQTAGAFNFSTANQNGSPVGELTGVSVDTNGNVIAAFSNGQTQKIFQIPLAAVANPDGLESVSGDAYIQTISSGIANLQLAGTSGVGTFTPSALEQSNVDLSTQLTDLIVAQQAYGANSKVLTVADSLLQELDQIIQS